MPDLRFLKVLQSILVVLFIKLTTIRGDYTRLSRIAAFTTPVVMEC